MKHRKCPKCLNEFMADNAQVIHCWPCRNEQSAKRAKAHSQVQNAVRLGTLARQPCEICGNRKSIAHHDDYASPLKVRWMCHAHHQQHHAKIADKPIELEDLDAYDHRIGTSLRDYREQIAAKWGE